MWHEFKDESKSCVDLVEVFYFEIEDEDGEFKIIFWTKSDDDFFEVSYKSLEERDEAYDIFLTQLKLVKRGPFAPTKDWSLLEEEKSESK